MRPKSRTSTWALATQNADQVTDFSAATCFKFNLSFHEPCSLGGPFERLFMHLPDYLARGARVAYSSSQIIFRKPSPAFGQIDIGPQSN